jgi:type II secretory pathway component GspD/PulD (secretin)
MSVLRSLYPQASITANHHANALVIIAPPDELNQMKTLISGIDIRNPSDHVITVIVLHTIEASTAIAKLRPLFPRAFFSTVGKDRLVISAIPSDQTQIAAILGLLDTPTATPAPIASAMDVVHLVQVHAQQAAKSAAIQFPHLRVSVNGNSVVLHGTTDDVAQARSLLNQLDVPGLGAKVSMVYRLHAVDAQSVADLLRRSFHNIDCYVNTDLNALSITASIAEQNRMSEAITQLDSSLASSQNEGSSAVTGNSGFEVVSLRSAIPVVGGSAGGSNDMTQSIIAVLQQALPSVKVLALATPGKIALMGDPYAVRMAKEYVNQLDVLPPLVVLDTKVFELDETAAQNIGLQLPTPVISTNFSEYIANTTGSSDRLGKLTPITRTPLSLQAQFNLLIQNGTARILADPRITTLSGHTATIRAGDTIGIITTVGGGTGTYATSQIQTFQTGVTLDITPLVTPGNEVTVALHPVVNSLTGIVNGVPQIATRDTETTVHLKNNETLIISGLIQESSQRSVNKVPFLANLPMLGSAFRNPQSSSTRNELVIVVTPHVLTGDEPVDEKRALPSPEPLPTLPPDQKLPVPDMSAGSSLMQQSSSTHIAPNVTTPISITAPPTPPVLVTPSPVASGPATASPTTIPSSSGGILLQSGAGVSPTAFSTNSASQQGASSFQSFVYGQAPSSNVATNSDPVRIYFASLTPTSLQSTTPLSVSATTTTNATKVLLEVGTSSLVLAQGNAGIWTYTGPIPSGSLSSSQTSFSATLTARRSDGSSASIAIPLQIIK